MLIYHNKIAITILLIIILILASLSSFLEIATVAISRHKLELLKDKEIWAKYAYKLKQNLEQVLIFSLFSNSVFNALFTTLTTVLIINLIGNSIPQSVVLPLATLSIAFFIIIFSEAVPKIIAARIPEQSLKFISIPAYYLFVICKPIIWVTDKVVYSITNIFISSYETSLSLEEIRAMVADKQSPFKEHHREILLKSLNLEKLTVKEVLIPLRIVEAVDITDDLEIIYKKIYTSHHTRIIVYSKNIDNIIGYIHIKDAVTFEKHPQNIKDLNKIIRPIDYIGDFVPLVKQISIASDNKKRIFVVINEHGDVSGIACLEDMLEMVFGNFTTESPKQKALAIKSASNQIIVDGTMLIRELNEGYGLKIPITQDAITINGLILKFLNGIPNVGVCFKLSDLVFEVINVGHYWVERVKITIPKNKI